MQSSAWISLLRLIPPAHHENLSLLTLNSTEISIQNIIRMEMDYLVLRGRLAGSSDAGRVFFVPYDQINIVAFQKEVKEPVVRAFFGEIQAAPAPAAAPARAEADTVAETDPAMGADILPTPSPATPPQESPTPFESTLPGMRPGIAAKSAILERLRGKAAAASPKQPSK